MLAAMAEGRSNSAIGGDPYISQSAVGKHVNSTSTEPGLSPGEHETHRRVTAVLASRRSTHS